jgi:hypothetical protein
LDVVQLALLSLFLLAEIHYLISSWFKTFGL